MKKNKTIQQTKVSPIKTKHKAIENGRKVPKVTPIKRKQSRSTKVKVETFTKLGKKKNLKFKRLKKKNQTTNNVNSRKLTMVSEITACNNVAVLFPKLSNGMHGFVYNVHKPVMTASDTKHDLMKESKLDLDYKKYIFIQESPENNSKVKTDSTTTNTSQYSKTCFVAVPNQVKYCKKDWNLDERKIVANMITS